MCGWRPSSSSYSYSYCLFCCEKAAKAVCVANPDQFLAYLVHENMVKIKESSSKIVAKLVLPFGEHDGVGQSCRISQTWIFALLGGIRYTVFTTQTLPACVLSFVLH